MTATENAAGKELGDAASGRAAIYFAPPPDHPLARLGAGWVGRDAATGEALPQPAVPGVPAERLAGITESPRHYAFHATLKAPFRLAEGRSMADLLATARAFAAARPAFAIRGLRVALLDGFIALVPETPEPELDALAAACVEHFEPLRAPLTRAELADRRAAGLTARQNALLERWGYPYVMEAFRFHMTLTQRLPAGPERELVLAALQHLLAPVTGKPLTIDAVSVFVQDSRASPFRQIERFPLADSG